LITIGFIIFLEFKLVVLVSLSIRRHPVDRNYRSFMKQSILLEMLMIGLYLRDLRLTAISLTGLIRIEIIDNFVLPFDGSELDAIEIHTTPIRNKLLGT
jgi:hypothetical protein